MKQLVYLTVMLIAANAHAQGWGWSPVYRASTIQEGYLTGLGRLWAGQGYFAESYGHYLIDREKAREAYIKNWSDSVELNWKIKDEYIARHKTENHLDRTERLLDMAERKFALDKRKNELIQKGVLKQTESYFSYNGKKFNSIDEFRSSPEFKIILDEHRMQEIIKISEARDEERRYNYSVNFGRMWSQMSWLDKQHYLKLNPQGMLEYRRMWADPDYMWRRLREKQDSKFYELRPYMNPEKETLD